MLPGIDPRWEFAAVLFFAWIWGSFLNQCVDRTGIRRTALMQSPAPIGGIPDHGDSNLAGGQSNNRGSSPHPMDPRNLSMLHPARSICLGCGRTIPWYENLPVASYLLLRGRCRSCGMAIGRRTLFIELATPVLFGGIYLLWSAQHWPLAAYLWALGVVSWTMVTASVAARGGRQLGGLVALGLLLLGVGAAIAFT